MNEPLLPPEEIARRLGVSVQTVLRMSRAGKLPRVDLSRRLVRFDWQRVRAAVGMGSDRAPGQSEQTE